MPQDVFLVRSHALVLSIRIMVRQNKKQETLNLLISIRERCVELHVYVRITKGTALRLGIMQPYFFPYVGYFSLIKHSDLFILFDTAQYIRHGWIERNRMLKQSGEWQYIAVPLVKHSRETPISDVLIDNDVAWQDKIIAQLSHYKKNTPHYWDVIRLLKEVFDEKYKDITHLDKACLEAVCRYLGINTPIKIYSEMDIEVEDATAPDEWALNICKAIPGTTEYWNPPGGVEFFDREKYKKAGIDIKFQTMELPIYKQKEYEFVPGLSILDVMMFNGVEQINKMLDLYTLS